MGMSRYYLVGMKTNTNPNREDQLARLDATVKRELRLQFGSLVTVGLFDADAEAMHDVFMHVIDIEDED